MDRLKTILAATILATTAGTGGLADGHGAIVAHGISSFGELKYDADFPHLDYVNPDAPKGGVFSTWGFGTFDNLNPFILKGNAPREAAYPFESLMVGTADEPDSMYGLIAESIEYPEDRQWAIFTLREEAAFADGSPITADDVVFSYEILLAEGLPSYQVTFQDFEAVEALDPRRVRFTFREGAATRELPMTAAGIPILSRAYWEGRDFAETTLEPPLGSGPYRVKDVDIGRSISLERNPDYWGRDLPLKIGRHNYDEIRVEYFADYTVAFEGFKGGAYSFREEFLSKLWATGYDFPAIDRGWIVKDVIPDGRIAGAQGWFFNLRRDKFADPRVREALGLMFNFEWSNETLFYGIYSRTDSFWENSDLQAEGLPTGAELALLEPLRADLPESVFTEEAFSPRPSSTRQVDRGARREAGRLLDEAGWTIGDDGLRRNADGEVLRVEIMNDSPSFRRIIDPFVENLRDIGVDSVHDFVDNAQAAEREKTFDFDIVTRRYVMALTPGDELRRFFGSESANREASANIMGLANPAIDSLIRTIEEAETREDLSVAVKALDRVLRATHVWVPQWYKAEHNVHYLDIYRYPESMAPYAMGELDVWWVDADRVAELEAAGAF
ncbi:MAG: extracellular solute-binding protein [Pseudomonadota bacterium]